MVSLPLGIVCGLAPWAARGLSSAVAAVAAVISAVVLAAGAASGSAPYPWTNIPVLLFALASGLLLGRAIPSRSAPMAVILGFLAAVDAIQVLAFDPSTSADIAVPPPWWFYSMFAIDLFGAWKAVGIFDLLLLTAIGEHWRRRAGPPTLAVIPGIVTSLLTNVVVALTQTGGLPLVPFIALGWLLSEAAYRRRPRSER